MPFKKLLRGCQGGQFKQAPVGCRGELYNSTAQDLFLRKRPCAAASLYLFKAPLHPTGIVRGRPPDISLLLSMAYISACTQLLLQTTPVA